MTRRTQEAASRKVVLLVLIGALALVTCTGPSGVPTGASPQPGEPWTTYLGNNARAGFQPKQAGLIASSPLHLRLLWSSRAGGPISVQPVMTRGLIYWGSWDGYMRATDLSGHTVWKTFLGQTDVPFKSDCVPAPLGVASTATVADSGKRSAVYVGGTDTFYALDALTGQVIWKTLLGSEKGTYLWSSPAVYNGSVYEGISSWGDCPLVQGRVVQMSAADGIIQHTFNVTPPGCVGSTVWGSPTIDETAGTIYFATANPGDCLAESLPFSVVQLRASDLAFHSSWRTPTQEDFGSTPTLFTTTIGSVTHSLLGIVNKNGIYYAFDRAKPLSVGPVWSAQITSEGGEDPIGGMGSISPSAWDGSTLYVAGGKTIINGSACSGGVRALNPTNGKFLWERCLADPVLAAVTAINGLLVVGAGPDLLVIASSSGKTLFTYHNQTKAKLNKFWGAASVSGGVIYMGSMDGTLFAFGP